MMIITMKQLRIDTRIRVTLFLTIVILSIVLCQGCEKSDSGQDVKSGAQGDGSTPKIGWFDITLKAAEAAAEAATDSDAFTSVVGRVYDGAQLETPIWEKTDERAGCVLSEPRVPFCESGCPKAVCVGDDECAENPTPQDVGTVTIQGLRTADDANEITLTSVSAAAGYQQADTLPFPAFDEGDEIRLHASGGEYEPFEIVSTGIKPLELLTEDEIPMERGQSMSLAWTPPGQADIARIQIKVDISHHGGAKGKIECDVPDTGSFEIPADLITQLIDLGYSGFPKVTVTRIATGSAFITPGRVDLDVQSSSERILKIPGLTSCWEDADCPDGQTCQQDAQCL